MCGPLGDGYNHEAGVELGDGTVGAQLYRSSRCLLSREYADEHTHAPYKSHLMFNSSEIMRKK